MTTKTMHNNFYKNINNPKLLEFPSESRVNKAPSWLIACTVQSTSIIY